MKEALIPMSHVYIPTKRKPELSKADTQEAIEAVANEILEDGLLMPIQVRLDHERKRYVLVNGLKRLEAFRMLGETEIRAIFVEARQY